MKIRIVFESTDVATADGISNELIFKTIVNNEGEEIEASSIGAEWSTDGKALELTVSTSSILCALTADEVKAVFAMRAISDDQARIHAEQSSLPFHEPIPSDIRYNSEHDNFYTRNGNGMGFDFHTRWYTRREEFPTSFNPEEGNLK